jgi:hypothetical protein
MTTDRIGASVSVGGRGDELLTAAVADIAQDQVVIDVSHPSFEAKRVPIKLGETKEVFFGDGNHGVRLRFTERK